LQVGLEGDALSLSRGGEPGATIDLSGPPSVLETLAQSLGPVPRVLLRDTDPAAESPVNRPGSLEMPSPEERAARLRLLGEIARGGMGAVLKGRDEDLGRDLAVKILLERHRDNPELVRRFIEEAQIGGQLQHPGIVPIYELGTFADRRPYFAMKLVKGQTLAALLAGRSSPEEGLPRFLGVFEQVCQTVAYAHARGVIHRDLKPSNIMVGGFGEVQVMDWGLAKVLPRGGVADDDGAGKEPEQATVIATARSGGDSDAELSRVGSVLGTPSYMAPEQARGEVERVDERADVFALGSILAEILTGVPPFVGRSSGEIQRKAARGETGEVLARLPLCGAEAELVGLARDCLASEPEDRPRDAAAVAARVTAYLAGVQERLHASERERAVAEARAVGERRKRRWQLGLAASVAASLLLGGIGLAVFAAMLKRQQVRAEANERAAIDAVKRFRDAVADNPELKDNPELESLRRALLKEPLAFFRSLHDRLQADGQTTPEALARLASATFDLGMLTAEIGDDLDAVTALREALAIRKRLADAHPTVTQYQLDLAASHNNLGVLLSATGDQAGARAAYEAARAIQQRLAAAHPTAAGYQHDLAKSHGNLGNLLSETGDPAGARAAYEAARAILERLVDAHPTATRYQSDLAKNHANLGNLLSETSDPVGARAAYEAARAIRQRLVDSQPTVTQYQSDLAGSHVNLGRLLSATGDRAGARAQYEAAQAILQRLAVAHPTVTEYQSVQAASQNNLAILLSETGDPAGARAALEAALAIRKRLAEAHPTLTQFQLDLAACHGNLGNLLFETGDRAAARTQYEPAQAIFQRLADAHPTVTEYQSLLGRTLGNLAAFDLEAAQFAVAADRLRQAITWQKKALAANPASPTDRQGLRKNYTRLLNAARGLDDAGLAAEAQRGLADLDAADPRLAALDGRLAAVLKGEPPKDQAERLALAPRAYDTRRYAAATRLWTAALAADPTLTNDRQAQHRYNAACAATLAVAGRGEDDPKPDDADRARLRRQALDWLKAELAAWSQVLEGDDPKARTIIAPVLRHWHEDPDLASVREPAALAALPDSERAAWQALWDEVTRLLKAAATAP
jgi:tetratricopeptide (TPR) repeat protein